MVDVPITIKGLSDIQKSPWCACFIDIHFFSVYYCKTDDMNHRPAPVYAAFLELVVTGK